MQPALELDHLSVHFPTAAGVVKAVEAFNLTILPGEKWCLLGESGCGKTVLALSILRLLPAGTRISGAIRLSGVSVLDLDRKALKAIRGGRAAMIFEQPASCLDPLFTVGDQVAETLLAQGNIGRRAARQEALELLARVRLPSPEKRARQYPHQLSGGMIQKVMIAIALARKSKLIIADEPTTALDVSVQIQIIDLLNEVSTETGASLLLISHDPDTAKALCQQAVVMYAGQMVEQGDLKRLFQAPRHPYTQALLKALAGKEPRPIPGGVPALTDLPAGCPFHPRCPMAMPQCRLQKPELKGNLRCYLQTPCSASKT